MQSETVGHAARSGQSITCGGRLTTVCVTGARNTFNYGTVSIIASAVEEINKLLDGEVEFVILTPNADADKRNYERATAGCRFRVMGPKLATGLPYSLRSLILLILSVREYARCNIVVDMRGEGFSNARVAIMQSAQMLTARIMGKPFVIYAQSLGPFQSAVNRFLARVVLRQATAVTVRESVSMNYFNDLHTGRQAYQVADQAVLLRPAPLDQSERILESHSIVGTEEFVGLCPTTRESNISLAISTCNHVISRYGARVLLIPHANDEPKGGCRGNDDLAAARTILEKVGSEKRLALIAGDYTAKEIKGVISRCSMCVCFRWHSAVASLSAGVPTIAVTSQHKSAALQQFQMERFLANPEGLTFENLRTLLDVCWRERKRIHAQLVDHREDIASLAELNAVVVANLLRKHPSASMSDGGHIR